MSDCARTCGFNDIILVHYTNVHIQVCVSRSNILHTLAHLLVVHIAPSYWTTIDEKKKIARRASTKLKLKAC